MYEREKEREIEYQFREITTEELVEIIKELMKQNYTKWVYASELGIELRKRKVVYKQKFSDLEEESELIKLRKEGLVLLITIRGENDEEEDKEEDFEKIRLDLLKKTMKDLMMLHNKEWLPTSMIGAELKKRYGLKLKKLFPSIEEITQGEIKMKEIEKQPYLNLTTEKLEKIIEEKPVNKFIIAEVKEFMEKTEPEEIPLSLIGSILQRKNPNWRKDYYISRSKNLKKLLMEIDELEVDEKAEMLRIEK